MSLSNLHANLPPLCSSGALFLEHVLSGSQEEWQRARPACEIEYAAEILREVLDQPGTSMLGAEHHRGPLGQTWVLYVPAGSSCTPVTGSLCCSCLPAKGSVGSSHENAASWPALSSRLCPPKESLNHPIPRSPWLDVTAKACPVAS